MASQPPSTPPESFSIISTLRYDPSIPTTISNSTTDIIYPDPKDSPYYLLRFHRDRLLNAATHFNWPKAINFLQRDTTQFAQFLDQSIPDRTKPWRLRIALDSNSNCTVDVNPVAACSPHSLFIPQSAGLDTAGTEKEQSSPPWRLHLDTRPIKPSAFTTHKTTVREEYNSARERVGIMSFLDPAEVLVFNPGGEVMEGSITTPYFRRRVEVIDGEGGSGSEEDGVVWVTPPLSSGGNDGTTRRYALEKGFCVERVVRVDEMVDGEECWLSNGVRGFIRAVVVLRK